MRPLLLTLLLLALLLAATGAGALPAFPGAEGYGAETTTGGRGGVVVAVTRLDDPIPPEPGTLRYALESVTEPRIVVFRVGGTIALAQPMGYFGGVTIAGQTAPGDGICIKGKLNPWGNVILRHLRIRPEAGTSDCIEVWGNDVVIDHCSISWPGDEAVGFHSQSEAPERRSTIQWCIISEGEKGVLASMGGAHEVTFHHNLFAHNYIRNPLIGTATFPQFYDLRNNVVYDLGNTGFETLGWARVNMVGNYFKLADPTRLHRYCVNLRSVSADYHPLIYLADHYGPRVAAGEPMWNEVRMFDSPYGVADEALCRVTVPFDTPPVTTHDAQTAYTLVLARAGATLPVRDRVDARIVADVTDGLNPGAYHGGAAKSVEEWATLTYADGVAPPDTDGDGMADAWETAHGLNPHDPADGPMVAQSGYTNVEEYLNALAGGVTPEPEPEPEPEPPAPVQIELPAGTLEVILSGGGLQIRVRVVEEE